jgi:plastocyanin
MTNTAKADHEIKVELKEFPGKVMAAVPAVPPTMKVGETVSYSTAHGTFRIEFDDGSLFRVEPGPATITDSVVLTLIKEGKYNCKCFVTPPGGQEIGWSSHVPQSGGVHDVGE